MSTPVRLAVGAVLQGLLYGVAVLGVYHLMGIGAPTSMETFAACAGIACATGWVSHAVHIASKEWAVR